MNQEKIVMVISIAYLNSCNSSHQYLSVYHRTMVRIQFCLNSGLACLNLNKYFDCYLITSINTHKQITMIVLPWYIRFGIDCFIVTAPFYYISKHPTLFFEYFQSKRRIIRRRDFTEIEAPKDSFLSVDQTKKLYADLGMEI